MDGMQVAMRRLFISILLCAILGAVVSTTVAVAGLFLTFQRRITSFDPASKIAMFESIGRRHVTTRRNRARCVTAPAAVTAAAAVILTTAQDLRAGSPTFTNETPMRLSAAPANGASDVHEKNYGVGDLDNDGDLDVVVGRRLRLDFPASETASAAAPDVLLMNIDGVLTESTAALAPALLVSRASRDVLVRDLNNDGFADVVVAEGTALPPTLLINQGFSDSTWLGLALAPAGKLPSPFNIDAWTISAGDLVDDDDAFPDLFIGCRMGNDRLLRNLGAVDGVWQGFADESSRLGTNANTSAVRSSEAVDVNGDGDVDIIEGVTNPTGTVRTLANDGTGVFTSPPQTLFSGSAYNFSVGDLNGNGVVDFYGVRNASDQIRLNDGAVGDTLTLGAVITVPSSNGFGGTVRVGDLDNSGSDDFLVCDLDKEFPADCARKLKIYFNSETSPFLTDGYPSMVGWTPNGTSDVALIDLDQDLDLDMLIGFCAGSAVWMQDGSPRPPLDPADLNRDGVVDGADLGLLLAAWDSSDEIADLNDDGVVDGADLGLLLAAWD